MKKNENKPSEASRDIQYIIVIPRSVRYWNYQIDEGKIHSIDSGDLYQYLSKFLTKPQYPRLVELISRYRMMLIDVRNSRLVELKQKDAEQTRLEGDRREESAATNPVSALRDVLQRSQQKRDPLEDTDRLLEASMKRFF